MQDKLCQNIFYILFRCLQVPKNWLPDNVPIFDFISKEKSFATGLPIFASLYTRNSPKDMATLPCIVIYKEYPYGSDYFINNVSLFTSIGSKDLATL